jgi:hypothetical protein
LKAAIDAAGQACSESSGDFQRGPSEQAPAKRHSALGRLTGADLQRCLSCPSVDGESW